MILSSDGTTFYLTDFGEAVEIRHDNKENKIKEVFCGSPLYMVSIIIFNHKHFVY